jgi:hypothetical protein
MSTNPRIFSQIIKANPGYFAIELVGNPRDGSFRMHLEPVLAWFASAEMKDNPDTNLTPICQEAFSDLYDGAVLRPDSRVVIRGVDHWASLGEYEQHLKDTRVNMPTAIAHKHAEIEEAMNAGVRHDNLR